MILSRIFQVLRRELLVFVTPLAYHKIHICACGMWFQSLMTCCSMKIDLHVLAPHQANIRTLSEPQYRVKHLYSKSPQYPTA